MVQTSKPQRAKVFITEYSPRAAIPGTVRSKLLREEIEEPCTRNKTGNASPALGAPIRLRNRLSDTSPLLPVLCAVYSLLQMGVSLAFTHADEAARPAPAITLRRVTERFCAIRSPPGVPILIPAVAFIRP